LDGSAVSRVMPEFNKSDVAFIVGAARTIVQHLEAQCRSIVAPTSIPATDPTLRCGRGPAPPSRAQFNPNEIFVEFVPGWGIRLAVDRLFATARIDHSISVEVPDVSTFSALVRAGLGIGFLTGSILGATDDLVGIKVRPAASFEIGLAVPSGASVPGDPSLRGSGG
jgi:DNA-binding transcriptional LysR family regulator